MAREFEALLSQGYTQTPDGDIFPPMTPALVSTDQRTPFTIWRTTINGLLVWDRPNYPDARGPYQEKARIGGLSKALGRQLVVEQVSESVNEPRGVLRGLHAEPIDKIVIPTLGRFFIAIADLRPDSETFGKYTAFVIDRRNLRKPEKSILVCSGLANSFETIGDESDNLYLYHYCISEDYKTSEGKRSVKWDDPDLNIPWPIKPTIMSETDRLKNPSLRDLFPEKFQ